MKMKGIHKIFLNCTGFINKTSEKPRDSKVKLVKPTTRIADIGKRLVSKENRAVNPHKK